jgi:uncharacterized protein DUF3108
MVRVTTFYAESRTGESFEYKQSGRKVMSRLLVAVLAVALALACAAAALLWLHGRGAGKTVVHFTPDASAGESVPAAKAGPAAENRSAALTASKNATAIPAPPVFRPPAGEVLEFRGSVANVSNVASLRLSVNGRQEISGKAAWHLRAYARTQNPLRMVFELDDEFDSYSAPADFSALQYEMHLNERGQKVESVQRFTATGHDIAPPGVTETRVLPGTRDPLGMLQYLRSVEWGKTPAVDGPVYDGRKLYQVRARKIGSAEVQVPAGKFLTVTVEIKVFDNGTEMKDAHFALYLANDEARTPVLLEAVLPFAAAKVELLKKSEQMPAAADR